VQLLERATGWWTRAPVTLTTAAASALLLLLRVRGSDLPAQVLRVDRFRDGGIVWNANWFGGHPTLGYSTLLPALGAALGVSLLGFVSTTSAVAVFEAMVHKHRRGTLAAAAFALPMIANLAVGRLAFGLGVAFGLAALAVLSRAAVWAGLFAVLTALSSPLAGLFLALAVAAWSYSTKRYRTGALVIALALAPSAITTLLFGTGGSFPFHASSLIVPLLLCAAVALATREPMVRAGSALYAVACVGAFFVSSPLGANVVRLAPLVASPLLLLGDTTRVRRLLLFGASAAAVAGWQVAVIAQVASAARDPSTRSEYYEDVVSYLSSRPGPLRVEIPFTEQHWETAYVAAHVSMARGWERQIDRRLNPEFYDDEHPLDASTYHEWLDRNGVSYVALPDTNFDSSSRAEADLIASGLDYLRPVYRDEHWTVYELRRSPGLLTGPGRLLTLTDSQIDLRADVAGSYTLRVRASRNWHITQGSACIQPTDDGWISLDVTARGVIVIEQRVDLVEALVDRDTRTCN
jgi:hypothetical protein